MQKITTFIVLMFLNFSTIQAQSNMLNATVVDQNGKTISGVIDYKERSKTPSSFLFKPNDAPARLIYPIDIQGFTIDKKSEKYISAIVDLNKETLNESELNEFNSMKEAVATLDLVRDTVFLLTLATGEINLYALIDKNSKTHFLYQKGNASIKELIYRKVKINLKENQKMGEIKAFATQLKTEVLDCPNAFSMIKEESFYYKEYDLMRVVKKYNECKGKSTFTLPAKKKPITFYALAGVNRVAIEPQFSIGYSFDDKAVSAVNPTLGAGIDIGTGKNINPIGFVFELLYKPLKATLKSEENQTGYLNTQEFNFNMSILQINALFRYTIQRSDFQPFMKAGIGYAMLANADNSVTEIRGFNNAKTISSYLSRNNTFNLCLALGVKKNAFHLEWRLDYGVKSYYAGFNNLRLSYLSVLLGYTFFSNRK
jgi:hypothetical protein